MRMAAALQALVLLGCSLAAAQLQCPGGDKWKSVKTYSVGSDIAENVVDAAAYKPFFDGKKGIEIGGPSGIFKAKDPQSVMPLYSWVGDLDNAIFDGNTLWAKQLKDGGEFMYEEGKAPGKNYVRDGTNLVGLANASYDFVLSSHNIEHMANPLKAMAEYVRVLKPGGTLLLVLPYAPLTFDHKRNPANMEHLIQKWQAETPESDLSNLDEILRLHDLSRDPGAPQDPAAFKERCLKNNENRALHQYVYDFSLIAKLDACFDVEPRLLNLKDINQIVLGTKPTQPAGSKLLAASSALQA